MIPSIDLASLVHISLFWGICLLAYVLFIKKETRFNTNRLLLIGILFGGLILPFLPKFNFTGQSDISFLHVLLDPITISSQGNSLISTESTFNVFSVLMVLYYSITCLFFFRICISTSIIIRTYLKGKKSTIQDHPIIETKQFKNACSFFNWIFIPPDLSPHEASVVFKHEKAHVDYGHSWDKLFTELIKVFFWWNPIIYMIQRELNLVHEYQADSSVINQGITTNHYARMLLKIAKPEATSPIANFIHSQFKNRITMMYQSKFQKQNANRYLFILLAVFVSYSFYACQKDQTQVKKVNKVVLDESKTNENASQKLVSVDTIVTFDYDTKEESIKIVKSEEDIFKVVEQMPRFPGCEDLKSSQDAIKDCSQGNLLQFIYTNLKYPKEASENGVEGIVVIQFVVDSNGNIRESKVVRDIGKGCGDEALRVVNLMNNMEEGKWIPGKQNGKTVAVLYTLPIKYKLEG